MLHPGSAEYDAGRKSYTVAGSGENMWSTADAFQFVWKKATGDLALTADVAFVGTGTDPHRKACLMIRQTLDADSAYVDVALHGDGLTSLQFREAAGEATHEVQANVSGPGGSGSRSGASTSGCSWRPREGSRRSPGGRCGSSSGSRSTSGSASALIVRT